METIVVAFVAGVLTVLAPCILPLLPVIVGGTLTDEQQDMRRPIIIAASLSLSVIVFTLLLKASTTFLGVPPMVWQAIAGGLVILLGLTLLFPKLWEPLGAKLNISSGRLLGRAATRKGTAGAVLTGAALGPVFNSCSPTYAFILASVLPGSLGTGLASIVAYGLGLGMMLLLIGLLGQRLIARLGWATNPSGWFKRTIGVIFIVVGLFVLFGLDRQVQTFFVEQGWYDAISGFEHSLLN
jgi:cytochrome c-type biogenesis protein